MRNLLIAAVSAFVLSTGSVLAAGDGLSGGTAMGTAGAGTVAQSDTAVGGNVVGPHDETIGSGDLSGMTGTGTNVDRAGTSALSPQQNQTATGTHCPPGRPNCGPEATAGGTSGADMGAEGSGVDGGMGGGTAE
ncbi:hypothetical protein [Azospirillum halopraeferens]|uniref:hypothetical protein n=1 Tax=Azospirillum halopraeferens TaxID=34010 RepID=UPI0012EB2CEF|nr:hypothetical protein [Azospirillum halopraeferens]